MRSTPPGVSHQEILLWGVVGTAEVVVTSESHLRVARDRLKVARAARHAERTDYLYQGKSPVVVKNEQRNSAPATHGTTGQRGPLTSGIPRLGAMRTL